MAKRVDASVLDGAFGVLDDANRQVVCHTEPTNYVEVTTYKLAEVAMTPVTDFVKAAGDVSGRKCTVAAKSGVSITGTGTQTATHVALANSANSTLLYVTTCTNQALTNGGTVNIPAWKVEIAGPT